MTITRRSFVATGGSLGLLTLAACSSDPVSQAEETETSAVPATTTATESTSAVELYTGAPIPPLSSEALHNPKGLQDRPIGGKNAKVVVIEYTSPTCSHCAAFAMNTYPEFKEKYINTGKITFILRPFVRNVLDAVVFLLAEATDDANYTIVVETYFKSMMTWATSETPRDAIEKIALQLGFTHESFNAALTNQDLFDALDVVRQQALNEFDVKGTPTFFINGKPIVGAPSLEVLSAEIDPQLG